MQSAIRWLPVGLWMGAIFAVSAVPGSSIPGGWEFEGHAFEYAILGALVTRAVWGRVSHQQAIATAVMFASIYGITDEVHQIFVPGRTADPMDWAIDTVAAALGAICFAWVVSRLQVRAGNRQ